MRAENFYRRYPSAALNGMMGLSLEERGAYNTIIDLLYLTWRPVEYNPPYIAAHCLCAVQKINPIIRRLIEKGKLVVIDDGGQEYLTNEAFERERDALRGAPKNRSGRGEVREKSAGVGEKSPLLGGRTKGKQAHKRLEKNRTELSVPKGHDSSGAKDAVRPMGAASSPSQGEGLSEQLVASFRHHHGPEAVASYVTPSRMIDGEVVAKTNYAAGRLREMARGLPPWDGLKIRGPVDNAA